MERTQKLLGIALAVIALDGCRPSSPGPGATPTPGPQGAATSTGIRRTAGAGAAAAAASYSRFGGSGFHGGG